jgi:hypothetical protein
MKLFLALLLTVSTSLAMADTCSDDMELGRAEYSDAIEKYNESARIYKTARKCKAFENALELASDSQYAAMRALEAYKAAYHGCSGSTHREADRELDRIKSWMEGDLEELWSNAYVDRNRTCPRSGE